MAKIDLTPQEANLILSVLGDLPNRAGPAIHALAFEIQRKIQEAAKAAAELAKASACQEGAGK